MASTYYYLTEEEKNSIGRLGGNAPEWFDDKRDMVDEPGCHYGFYCTLQLKDAGAHCPSSFQKTSSVCSTTTSIPAVP